MEDTLSATFAALADPTRRAMLSRLAKGSASVTDLGLPFSLSQPAISKHLKVLEKAGLVTRGRAGQFRPCQLELKKLGDVADWVQEFRKQSEANFDRLEGYLDKLQASPKGEPRGKHSTIKVKGKRK